MLDTVFSQLEMDYCIEVPDYPHAHDIEEAPELMRQGWIQMIWRKHSPPTICINCTLWVHYDEKTNTVYYKHVYTAPQLVETRYIKATPTKHEPLLVIDKQKASRIVWLSEQDTQELLQWMEAQHA